MMNAFKFIVWLALWPISELFIERPEEANRPIGFKYIGVVLLVTLFVIGAVVLADRLDWLWF